MQFHDKETGELVIENLRGGLRNYGYHVSSEPICGQEVEYADSLRDVLKKIEQEADWLRRKYRMRGTSKRLLTCLHRSIPEPGWAISVDR